MAKRLTVFEVLSGSHGVQYDGSVSVSKLRETLKTIAMMIVSVGKTMHG